MQAISSTRIAVGAISSWTLTMNENDPLEGTGFITSPTLRAAFTAIHEAFGEPNTRCKAVNRILRQYPDALQDGIDALLAQHDDGRCGCDR